MLDNAFPINTEMEARERLLISFGTSPFILLKSFDKTLLTNAAPFPIAENIFLI